MVYQAKKKPIKVRYHHIWKLEVRKADIDVNTANSLIKPLPDHYVIALRRQMELQQAKEHKEVDSKEAVISSKIDRAEWAEMTKVWRAELSEVWKARESKGAKTSQSQLKSKRSQKSITDPRGGTRTSQQEKLMAKYWFGNQPTLPLSIRQLTNRLVIFQIVI